MRPTVLVAEEAPPHLRMPSTHAPSRTPLLRVLGGRSLRAWLECSAAARVLVVQLSHGLLPGPEPKTSFVPTLLPQTLAELTDVAQTVVAQRWPDVPAEGAAQAGMRFLFVSEVPPPGLLERLRMVFELYDQSGDGQLQVGHQPQTGPAPLPHCS